MDRQKLSLIVIVIGIPIFIVVMAKNLKPKKKVPAAPAVQISETKTPEAKVIKAVPAQKDAKSLELQKVRAELAWGRDPFFSDPYKAGQASDLQLLGISYRVAGGGFANINNEIVRAGDLVKGFEVVEVLKDKVLLKKGDQSFYLTFPEQ